MDFFYYRENFKPHEKNLNQALAVLANGNVERYLRSITNTFGFVIRKLPNGELDYDLKTNNKGSSIDMSGGYLIADDNGALRIIRIPSQAISLSGLVDGTTYGLYIVPKQHNYEEGTLTFTNGSKSVVVTGGNFNKLKTFDGLVIDTSTLGNNGAYKIYNVTSTTSLDLTEEFTGTTETNLKWKVSGDLGKDNPEPQDLIFYYDGYDIVLSSSPITGFKVAEFILSAGLITTLTDKRATNLYSLKNISQSVADDVVKGIINDITTIEGKAQAESVNSRSKDFIQKGIRSGASITLFTDNETLLISQMSGYNAIGQRFEVSKSGVGLKLRDYVTLGKIVEGDNYLFVDYLSPSGYQWIWSNSQTPSGNEVLLAKIRYLSDVIPNFSIQEKYANPTAIKTPSIIFENKAIINPVEGQMYYDYVNGVYIYYQLDTTTRGDTPVYKKVEMINFPRFTKLLNQAISSVAKSERIRFNLYIDAGKDSWFFFNGIQAPTLIGYEFYIRQMKIGLTELDGTVPSTYAKYDYANGKYPLRETKFSNIIVFEKEKFPDPFVKDSTIGMYFNGNATDKTVKLMVNGVDKASTNMQSDTNSAPTNKLYTVEILLESTDVIINPPGGGGEIISSVAD